jgi:hypothetical protein
MVDNVTGCIQLGHLFKRVPCGRSRIIVLASRIIGHVGL